MRTILHLLPALTLFPFLAAEPPPARKQPTSTQTAPTAEPAKKQDEAVQTIQRLLDEQLVETKHFQKELPLAQFLAALEKHLPKEKKLSLRIDKDAFGNKAAEVAATPMRLPASPAKTSLRTVLGLAVKKIKTRADYRLGPEEVVLTTPQRALYTATYDIRDLIEKPRLLTFAARDRIAFRDNLQLRNAEPAEKAALLVRALFSATDLFGAKPTAVEPESIEVLNGTRLVVRANATRHAEIADLLQVVRSAGDILVVVKARLYEVDAAFYTTVSKARRLTQEEWNELEKKEVAGNPPKGESLFKRLEKQTLILAGEEVSIDNGQQAALLSRHRVIRCLPSPDQVRRGEKNRQTVLEGISFLGEIQSTPDRRFVRLKLTEKVTELQRMEKLKVWDPQAPAPGKEVETELPILDETVSSRPFLIPDGGSLLVPVHFRPPSARAKDRWWVLSITPRIVIEEEERIIRQGSLEFILPALLADVLTNPRLKTTRDFYGTPGDKRFALVNSDAWTWPKDFRPSVPGHRQAPVRRAGNRLLGIRIDQYQGEENYPIKLTLLNAGGDANGAVVGGCTLRYTTREGAKGTVVELSPLP
ncbi:MAG: hypothetical protein HYS12_05890 [Planctomycetes bacterium]|nr:hypothetical protein [Planctomycetota bacterium]